MERGIMVKDFPNDSQLPFSKVEFFLKENYDNIWNFDFKNNDSKAFHRQLLGISDNFYKTFFGIFDDQSQKNEEFLEVDHVLECQLEAEEEKGDIVERNENDVVSDESDKEFFLAEADDDKNNHYTDDINILKRFCF